MSTPTRPSWVKTFTAYAIATVSVAAAVFLTIVIPSARQSPFMMLAVGVMVSASLGVGPGVFATVLGAVAGDYFLIPPFYSFTLFEPGHAVTSLLFCVVGGLITWITHGFQLSKDRVLAANQMLAEAQRRSELERDRFSAVISSMSDEVWVADAEGRLSLVNPAGVREFHLASEELHEVERVAASLEVYRADGSPRPVEEAPPLRALKGERVLNEEEIVRTPATGQLRHREVNATPVQDASGAIVGSVCVVRDITERKRAGEEIAQNQRTFSELVERAPFGIYVVDSQFRVAHMNAGSQAGAFRNVRPLIGRDFAEVMRILWPEPVAAGIIAEFRHTLETGEPYYSPRFTHPRHDVQIVESYEWELHRMTLPDGQYGVICYYFDSTELHEARESLEHTRSVLAEGQRIAHLGTFEYVADTQTTVWSEEEYRIYGLDPAGPSPAYEVMLARSIHPDDAALLHQVFTAAVQSGSIYELEHRIVRLDGSVRWVYDRAHPHFDQSGKLVRYIGATLDITERKRAEAERERLLAEIQSRQALLDAVIEHLPVGIGIAEAPSGRLLRINERTREIWAMDAMEAADSSGYGKYTGFHPDGRAYAAEDWQLVRALKGEVVRGEEVDFIRGDGARRVMRSSAGPVVDGGGRVVAAVVAIEDITEAKQAEEALRAAEQEKRSILDNVNEIIAYHDTSHNLIWANKAYLESTGLSLPELKGNRCYSCWGLEQACDHCPVVTAIQTGGPQEGELTPENQSRWPADQGSWLVRAAPVRDSHGNIIGAIEVAHDITERKRAEAALRESEEKTAELLREARLEIARREVVEQELRRSNVDLEQFAFAISHDLRSPLNAVTSFSGQLDAEYHDKLGPEAKMYLDYITGAAARLRRLITDLLVYSKVAAPEAAQPSPRDSQEALHAAELNLQERIREARAIVTHGPLPQVSATPGLLTQVFQNLIENAIKFCGEAVPTVHVSAEQQGEGWRFCVEDNGIGIRPEHAEQVFRIFKRVHGDTYEGTGIGLAVCRKIVERQGGRIWAESEIGHGAKFYFTLPAAVRSAHAGETAER